MAIPNGLAPGFYNIEDILDRTVQTVDVETVSDAIAQGAMIHQRVVDAIYATAQFRTDRFKWRARIGGQRRVQPMTQDGTPNVQRSGLAYEVALPLQIIADSIGYNMWAKNKLTVRDVSDEFLQVLEGFNVWEKQTFLTAIFASTAWAYADDSDDIGSLTIQGLANGATDSQLYPLRNGSNATIDHYLAQSAAIADVTNPFDDAYAILKQHPSNSGPYVAKIASDLVATTKALANFRDLPSDFVDYGANATLAQERAQQLVGWGHEVVGVVEGVGNGIGMVIVEDDDLPSTYMVTEAIGAGAYVGVREENIDGAQIAVRSIMQDTNLEKTDFYRRAGKGVVNRVAATVTRIGNASYAVPTGYEAPSVGE